MILATFLRSAQVFCISLLVSACTINGTLQGLYGYYNETVDANAELMVKYSEVENHCWPIPIIDSTTNPTIIVANGTQLKNCLKVIGAPVLVYNWAPNCTSDACKPLGGIQSICDSLGLKLIVVAEYYDLKMMELPHQTEYPIYAIDVQRYNSNLVPIYTTKFYKDLFDMRPNEFEGRFLLSQNGRYHSSYLYIDSLVKKIDYLKK